VRYRQKATVVEDALRYVGAPEAQRRKAAEYFDFLSNTSHPGPDADAFLNELPVGLLEVRGPYGLWACRPLRKRLRRD
jgi:hypothetical protein